MSGGGSSGNTTTVQKSDPWAEQKPYLTYGFDQAKRQYTSDTPSYYPGSTVSPLSDTTKTAIGLQSARALNGSPLQSATNSQLSKTINGDYLNSNPYLDANFNAGADSIKSNYWNAVNGINSGFSGSGRYGSGAQQFATNQAQDTLNSGLGDLYNKTYYNNYATERGNQMNAMGMAPAMINQDYTDISKLSDAGAALDAWNQAITDADVNKWNYNQNLPANKLGQYMNLVQGGYGNTQTTMTPTSGSNALGNVMGAGLLGLAGYNSLSK